MNTLVEVTDRLAMERNDPSALDLPAAGAGPRSALGGRPRRGRGAVGVGAAVLAAGVLVAGTLLTQPPTAPAGARPPAATATGLPAMPASMGFWDFVLPPAPAPTPLPAMPNDMGFWDHLR
jgi:hypothetical protein